MIPIPLVRVALGLLTVFFAHFLGRAVMRVCRRREAGSRLTPWVIRFVLALGAIVWSGGWDWVALLSVTGALAAGGYGAWSERHPPEPEDLTKVMFPEDPENRRGGEEPRSGS